MSCPVSRQVLVYEGNNLNRTVVASQVDELICVYVCMFVCVCVCIFGGCSFKRKKNALCTL